MRCSQEVFNVTLRVELEHALHLLLSYKHRFDPEARLELLHISYKRIRPGHLPRGGCVTAPCLDSAQESLESNKKRLQRYGYRLRALAKVHARTLEKCGLVL